MSLNEDKNCLCGTKFIQSKSWFSTSPVPPWTRWGSRWELPWRGKGPSSLSQTCLKTESNLHVSLRAPSLFFDMWSNLHLPVPLGQCPSSKGKDTNWLDKGPSSLSQVWKGQQASLSLRGNSINTVDSRKSVAQSLGPGRSKKVFIWWAVKITKPHHNPPKSSMLQNRSDPFQKFNVKDNKICLFDLLNIFSEWERKSCKQPSLFAS